MHLCFVPHVKHILFHAWSLRFIAVAFLLTVAEVLLPLIDGWVPIPHGVMATGAALAAGGAFVARLIAQAKITGVNLDG